MKPAPSDAAAMSVEINRLRQTIIETADQNGKVMLRAGEEIAALKAELAEAKSALHDVCLECKDWEYNYGRLCKSYAKITGELAEYRGRVEKAMGQEDKP